MRILNTLQRIAMLIFVLIPVAAICLNVVLTALGAQRSNAIVSAVHKTANFFIIGPFEDVFADQNYVQDAAVALVGYAILALLIVAVFRALRSVASTARPPSRPAADSGRPATATKTAAEPTKGQPEEGTATSESESSA